MSESYSWSHSSWSTILLEEDNEQVIQVTDDKPSYEYLLIIIPFGILVYGLSYYRAKYLYKQEMRNKKKDIDRV